jgi:hypothetical protein
MEDGSSTSYWYIAAVRSDWSLEKLVKPVSRGREKRDHALTVTMTTITVKVLSQYKHGGREK